MCYVSVASYAKGMALLRIRKDRFCLFSQASALSFWFCCLSGLKKTCFFLKILLNLWWLFQGHSGTSLCRWRQMESHKPWRWEQAEIRNAFRKQPLEHAFWSLRSWSPSFGSTMFAVWSWSIRRRSPPTSWNLGSITRCKLSLRTE